MKTTAIFIGLFFVCAVVAEDEEECPIMTALKKSIDECVEELNPREDILKLVVQEKGVDIEEVQCFQACMMIKAGLMENNHVQFDKMEEVLKSLEDADEENIMKIMDAVKGCKDEAEVSEDQCEVAGNYAKCLSNAKKDAGK